jgi:hypothetical protein
MSPSRLNCGPPGSVPTRLANNASSRARIPTRVIEAAQSAADMLTEAGAANKDRPANPASRRQKAADAVKIVVECIADVSFNLESVRSRGVGEALDRNLKLVKVLARLSNETSATWTPSGRAILPDGPAVTDDQLIDLDTRLRELTGLPLAVRSQPLPVVAW